MASSFETYRTLINDAAAQARTFYSSITIGNYYMFSSSTKTLLIKVTNKSLTGTKDKEHDIKLDGQYIIINRTGKSIEGKNNGSISNILQSGSIDPLDDYESFKEITKDDLIAEATKAITNVIFV